MSFKCKTCDTVRAKMAELKKIEVVWDNMGVRLEKLFKSIETCEERARDLGFYHAEEAAEAKTTAEGNSQTEPQSLSDFLAAEEEGL